MLTAFLSVPRKGGSTDDFTGTTRTGRILQECRYGSRYHPDLRQELCKQLEFYQSRKEEIRSQMQQAHVQPVQQSDMAKFWANANIQLHCLGGASANEIAKLMLKGTNTGVVQLTEVLHNSPDISDQLKRQGKAFVRHEEAYMERLKAYL